MGQIQFGHAFDPETEGRPLTSSRQLERVRNYIRQGKESGGFIRLDGGLPSGVPKDNFYFKPTVFANVNEEMAFTKEEIFEPALTLFTFRNLNDLIERANRTQYGLAASIWPNNFDRAHIFSRKVQEVIIWINGHWPYDAAEPFDWYKQNVYGRELDETSLHGYTQIKTVQIGYNTRSD